MSELAKVFEHKKPFITYVTAGDPNMRQTKNVLLSLQKAGADIIELGVPFSDPLADGPVIQHSHQRALAKGASLVKIISLLKEMKTKLHVPIVLMGAVNLFLAYGLKQFFADAKNVGVAGLIIPDLPPEEAKDFIYLSKHFQVELVFLASTASSPERLKLIAEASGGFIYLISTKGLTGERKELDVESLRSTIQQLRELSTKPIAVGFGVSNPDQVRTVLGLADGVIIGSALVSRLESSLGKAVGYLKHLIKKGGLK